ncbi:hypothetical protein [Paracoccus sp. TOH]|uniref:hypothetical protein n=1 Tax=Paracoccus sp. TOH TaxID=1263728 RepID=UPI0025B26C6D|nr:hypothetical protein [Paracoccus sp. TOH]WJS85760.1 Arm DNA-binding domain-containing protein [Paracoccus sp. TOH]
MNAQLTSVVMRGGQWLNLWWAENFGMAKDGLNDLAAIRAKHDGRKGHVLTAAGGCKGLYLQICPSGSKSWLAAISSLISSGVLIRVDPSPMQIAVVAGGKPPGHGAPWSFARLIVICVPDICEHLARFDGDDLAVKMKVRSGCGLLCTVKRNPAAAQKSVLAGHG